MEDHEQRARELEAEAARLRGEADAEAGYRQTIRPVLVAGPAQKQAKHDDVRRLFGWPASEDDETQESAE